MLIRTLSRTSDTTDTRNLCVIKVIFFILFTYSEHRKMRAKQQHVCKEMNQHMINTNRKWIVSVVSDVRERVRDLGSPLRFMLRRSLLVECVSVLHGTCLQCRFFFIHQYVQPCLSKNPKYTFYPIKNGQSLDLLASPLKTDRP
jgi:hypothetical protein